MNTRYSPEAAEWVKSFEGRYVSITASLNGLLKERQSQHLSDHATKQIQHRIDALEQCLSLLTAPKPPARRGPLPGSKYKQQSSASTELPTANTTEGSVSGGCST